MAYVALYRAYRPQKFSEVAGQRHIVTTLQNALRLNKVAHAYLFSGPRGTGKTTMAKIMAKALNCEKGISVEPCCSCDICKGIAKGIISDVMEIDAASNTSVDDIREIRDKVKYLPSVGRYKVYIIDEVHMLSTSAFNALLKTLEEPPSHAIFILATTEPQKIPATILSRCQRFDFQGISEDDIKSNLLRVINAEKLNVSDDAINLISEVAEGGMRDALSLLDQSVSYSTDDIIDVNDVLAISGNINSLDIINLIDSCYNNKQEDILKTINNIINDGKEIPKIVSDIVSFLRDMLMFKSGFGEKSIYKNKDFIHLCNKIDKNLIYGWLQDLNDVQNNIKFTNQKRTYLELGLLKMSDKELNDYHILVEKVNELERKITLLQSNKSNNVESYKDKPIKEIKEVKEYDKSQYSSETFNNEIVIDDSFITVSDVSNILYNGSKPLKEELVKILGAELTKNPNNPLLGILGDVIVGARSQDEALLVLADDARCNRLMRSDNYTKLLNLINNSGTSLKSFICISKNTWDSIMNDFKSKYNKETNPKPVLNEIKILVKRFKKEDNKVDPIMEVANSLFPNMNINIKGE
ncbi:MAG: DNA polymerase III subunit gamma/tau [Anaeroplasmataceae bacterium]